MKLNVTPRQNVDADTSRWYREIAQAVNERALIADLNGTPSDGTVTTAKLAAVIAPVVSSLNGGQIAGMRNKIINGKMEIAQRGMSFPGLNNPTYTLDRFYWSPTTTSAIVTVSQQADAPSNNEFQSSLRVTITTADTSIPASDLVFAAQAIEGYNVRDLIGRTFTLSFWVRSSKVGIHCIGLRNSGSDRSYVAQYTINSANTWEQKSITVSGGLITAGTWNWTSGVGLLVQWALAAGTTFQTTAGAWQTGNFLATANQVNCLDVVGNIFAITGVQLELGSVATPFEHRHIGMELSLCQRYYWVGGFGWVGQCVSATNGTVSGTFPVPLRAKPTFGSISGAGTNALIRSGGTTETINTLVNSNADKNGGWIYFGGGGYTTGAAYTIIKDFITASAEL